MKFFRSQISGFGYLSHSEFENISVQFMFSKISQNIATMNEMELLLLVAIVGFAQVHTRTHSNKFVFVCQLKEYSILALLEYQHLHDF